MIKQLIIFLLLAILPYSIDIYKHNLINNKPALIILLIHYFLSTYLYFGSLIFGYYGIHGLFIIISIAIFIKSKFKCPLTNIYNDILGKPHKSLLQDIPYYIYKATGIKYIHLYILLIILFYDYKYMTNIIMREIKKKL